MSIADVPAALIGWRCRPGNPVIADLTKLIHLT
jgi:hypothetical protein